MEQRRFDTMPPSAASDRKVSEYNQEMPQSPTVDQPKASGGVCICLCTKARRIAYMV